MLHGYSLLIMESNYNFINPDIVCNDDGSGVAHRLHLQGCDADEYGCIWTKGNH